MRDSIDALEGGQNIDESWYMNLFDVDNLEAALFNLMRGAYIVNELLAVIRLAGFTGVSLIICDARRGSGIVTAVRH